MTAREDLLTALEAWRDRLEQHVAADPAELVALDSAIAQGKVGKLAQPPDPLLTILLMGASGAGKSELLNALAGARIATSHHIRPTTTRPTIYVHREIPLSRLYEYGGELGGMARMEGVVQLHDRPELRHKIIIDAPDIDSYKTEHRELVFRLLPATDIVLYVVTPHNYKDDIGWEAVLAERGRRAFAFVLNKWDKEGRPRVPEGQADVDADLLQMLERRAGYSNPMVFRTSARWWAAPADQRGELPQPAPGEQFEELREWLGRGLSTSHIEQIQRRRRRALWGSLSAACEAAIPQAPAEYPGAVVASELDPLEMEGTSLFRNAAEQRARWLSQQLEEESRPRSAGPFGIMSGTFLMISGLAQRFKKVSGVTDDVSHEELAALTERTEALINRRTASVLWKLRDGGLTVERLSRKWEGVAERAATGISGAFEAESARLLARRPARARIIAGWIIIIVFELAATAILGLAAWRLGEAFIMGAYLDLRFTLNLLALLFLLTTVGSGILAALFPPALSRTRRALNTAVQDQWHGVSEGLEDDARAQYDEIVALRGEGLDLFKQCDRQVEKLSAEISEVENMETTRLFTPA